MPAPIRDGDQHGNAGHGVGGALDEVIYLLVDHGIDAPLEDLTSRLPAGPPRWGVGWTLSALDGGRWSWSIPLAARGAATTAAPRVAKAVALRVLHDEGVAVTSWAGCGGGERPMFRALVGGTTPGR